jgi:hypothetical protein
MKNLLFIILSLILVGCATGYHSSGFTGGFNEMKLQDDIYKVGFSGNAYTGQERAKNFTLLRSAELTLENGYSYFIILDNNSAISTSTYTTPITATTTGTAYGYGSSANYYGTTNVSGGETYQYNKPSTNMTIKCFKEKPENINSLVYDALQIKTNLRIAYKLESRETTSTLSNQLSGKK